MSRFHHSNEIEFASNVMPLLPADDSQQDTIPADLYVQVEKEFNEISIKESEGTSIAKQRELSHDDFQSSTVVQEVEVSEELLKMYFGFK